MHLDLARLVPTAGDSGLVCRDAGAVLWVAARTPPDVVADLVERFVAAEHPASLIEQLGAVVATNDHSRVPPFALVARVDDGCGVFVFGAVQVTVEGPGVAETVVAGPRSVAGVQRTLTTELTTVVASAVGGPSPLTIDPLVDVRAGIVASDGFALTTADEPVLIDAGGGAARVEPAQNEPEPQLATEPAAAPVTSADPVHEGTPPTAVSPPPDGGAEPVPLVESGPGGETVAVPPAALSGSAAGATSAAVSPPPTPGAAPDDDADLATETVQGVLCGQGHLNDPRTRSCPLCGAPVVPGSPIVAGPRPSLGRLLFDDGTECALVADRVIGRQPETSPLVQNGSARGLRLEDPERSISRAHAEIRLVGWDVHFRNLSTTNGSFLWDPTSTRWVPLGVDQPLVLQPGMHIALGRRPALFESATRR